MFNPQLMDFVVRNWNTSEWLLKLSKKIIEIQIDVFLVSADEHKMMFTDWMSPHKNLLWLHL